LTSDGQVWLDRALQNLQLAIENELSVNPEIELNNTAFHNFAFDSHVPAYEAAGVLQLGVLDKVKILLTPNPADLLSEAGIRQATQIAEDQIGYYLNHPIFASQQARELIARRTAILVLAAEYIARHSGFFGANPTTPSELIRRVLGPWVNEYL